MREEKKSDERLFLTRELEVLVNVEQALDYIENDDAYTGEDYKILKKWNDKCVMSRNTGNHFVLLEH